MAVVGYLRYGKALQLLSIDRQIAKLAKLEIQLVGSAKSENTRSCQQLPYLKIGPKQPNGGAGEGKRVKMIKITITIISEKIPLLEMSENAKLLNSMLETNFVSDIMKNLVLFLTDQVWDRPS